MSWFDNVKRDILPKGEDIERPLYRYIPFDTLLQMINEKKNFLLRTSMWEDVYENFIMKENIVFNGKTNPFSNLSDMCFGQCWTTKAKSDAMWRIYSPDKKSVRIKTTIKKLWDSTKSNDHMGAFVIGKVQYLQQSTIEQDLVKNSPYSAKSFIDVFISSLFVKRTSFSHEREYRLIYVCDDNSPDKGEACKGLSIDPMDFIMNIFFDPRADQHYVDKCKRILVDAFKYPSKQIHKSTLYDFKPCTIAIK